MGGDRDSDLSRCPWVQQKLPPGQGCRLTLPGVLPMLECRTSLRRLRLGLGWVVRWTLSDELGRELKTDAFQASRASVVSTVESAALDLVGQVSLVGCSSGISPGLCGVRGTFCGRSAERSVDVLRGSVDVLRNVLWTFCVVPWTFCAVLMSQRQLSCESPQNGSQRPVLVCHTLC